VYDLRFSDWWGIDVLVSGLVPIFPKPRILDKLWLKIGPEILE
jgi:hypothetical protein